MSSEHTSLAWDAVIPSRPADYDEPAADTAAVVTYAAVVGGVRHVIENPLWSYDGDPTGGQLSVYSGGQLLRRWYITVSGPGFIPIRVVGRENLNMRLELTAGGAGVSGTVMAERHWEEHR